MRGKDIWVSFVQFLGFFERKEKDNPFLHGEGEGDTLLDRKPFNTGVKL